MPNENAPVINIKDFVIYVLKKWLYLFIATIFCALVIGGINTVSSLISNKDRYSIENKERLTKALTEQEISEIDNLFNRYLAYKQSIAYHETYLSNSLLMKMDPNKYPSLTTQYSVSSDHQYLSSSFITQSLGATEFDKIASVFGADTDPSRVSEIVLFSSSSSDTAGVTVDVDNQNSLYIGTVDNMYKWILTVTVHAFDETQCEEIMKIVEDAIQAQYSKLSGVGIDVSLTQISKNYTENFSFSLEDKQRDMISTTSSLKSEYASFEKSELSNLSSDEKAYFSFLKNQFEGKEEKIHFAKNCVVGGLLGFVLMFVIIALSYFFSDKIKHKGDYVYITKKDDIIDIVYSPGNHKGLFSRFVNHWINRVFYGIDDRGYSVPEKTRIIAKRVLKVCENADISSIYIVNGAAESTAISLLNGIADAISQKGIDVSSGKPLLNTDDLEKFEKARAIMYLGN